MLENKKTGNILVVDDSQMILSYLTKVLSEQGYQISTVKTGKGALPSVHLKIPDLILLDVEIPDLNGLEVCRLLKADAVANKVPVIFLSGNEEIEKKITGFKAGAVDYITKPFHDEELLTRIETHINLSQAQAQLEKQKLELQIYNDKLEKEIDFRKQIEDEKEVILKELNVSETKFRSLFEKSRDALMVMNPPSWKFTSVNKAAVEMFGAKSINELISVLPATLSPQFQPDGRSSVSKAMEMNELALSKGSHHFEWTHKRMDGKEFVVVVFLTRIEIDGEITIEANVRDITAIKKMESEKEKALQEVRKQDEQYRILVDNAFEAIFVIQDEMIKFANPSTLAMTGYSDQELKLKLFTEFVHPDDREIVLANYKKRMKGDLVVSQYTFRLVSPAGIVRWVEVSAILIEWEGRPASLNFLSDISERKMLEEVLRNEWLRLEKTIEERTAELRKTINELNSMNLRLEETGRYKSRFLSSMSHELRTPLNAVLGFSELLTQESFGHLNEQQLSYVKQIEESGKQLLQLITDLLDLSRIDAGNMVPNLTVFNPWEFIGTITEMMGTQFRNKEQKVNIDISPDTGYVNADLKKCKQIMVNLLSNAVKYTPVGGSIVVRSYEESGSMLRIEVSDTGIGISKEDCKNLFIDFYQIDKSRNEQLGGSGIGLALSRRLVELQGGKIGVESEIGKGTTFWFTLPLEAAPAQEVNEVGSFENQVPRVIGKKILVAEDDERNVMLITEVLHLWDYKVVIAKNGQEAVDLYLSTAPDLILMDLRMPVKDGMEATMMIREIERGKGGTGGKKLVHIPIIALTASVSAETRQTVLKSGFDMYLSKPVGISNIEDALKIFFEKDQKILDDGKS